MDGAVGKTECNSEIGVLSCPPCPKNTQWFVLVHYQLAALYHTLEQFPRPSALSEVAEHPEVKG